VPEDGMEQIPALVVERTMKVQEVILRATAKKIGWIQVSGDSVVFGSVGIYRRTVREEI